jgi:hypothetical protein
MLIIISMESKLETVDKEFINQLNLVKDNLTKARKYGIFQNFDSFLLPNENYIKDIELYRNDGLKFLFDSKNEEYKELISNLIKFLEYNILKMKDLNQFFEEARNRGDIKETSTVGGGGATFSPGEGENYATPKAFNSNKKAKGTKNNYYYKLGWKLVDTEKLHKQAKGIEHKDLWKKKLNEQASQQFVDSLNLQDDSIKQFITTRMSDFDKIEDKLNILLPLLKKAKQETMDYYKNNPDFKIVYGSDLAVDYLNDIITLFKTKK